MSISIQIELIMVKDSYIPIDDIQMKVYFPPSSLNSNLSVTTGDFEFNSKESCGYWTISKIDKTGVSAVLKGNLTVDAANTSCVLQFSCKIEKFSATGGGITKVSISKNPGNVNFYKGGRQITKIKNLEMIF